MENERVITKYKNGFSKNSCVLGAIQVFILRQVTNEAGGGRKSSIRNNQWDKTFI